MIDETLMQVENYIYLFILLIFSNLCGEKENP